MPRGILRGSRMEGGGVREGAKNSLLPRFLGLASPGKSGAIQLLAEMVNFVEVSQ